MTPIEYMEKQVVKHRTNYDREVKRGVSEEQLQNIRNKINHYEAAVVTLKKVENKRGREQ